MANSFLRKAVQNTLANLLKENSSNGLMKQLSLCVDILKHEMLLLLCVWVYNVMSYDVQWVRKNDVW
jgi:hypothetical protein